MKEYPRVKDFGWANGWSKDPEMVRECRLKKHKTEEHTIGHCMHEVRCDICGYKYKYDSSG